MAKIEFRVDGLEEISKELRRNLDMKEVKSTVKRNGKELQQKIHDNAEFKKGYQTGTTKRSVGLTFTDAGFTAESGPTTEYSEYLERGTRRMEAQPFVRPAFEDQKEIFIKDLKGLVR